MITIKTWSGVRASVFDEFSRKSIERYFVHTFVYHAYTIITNTIMFTAQRKFYGDFLIPNIIATILVGGSFTLVLWNFTLFKDRDQRIHQELWCGDVVDSSDEEQANDDAEKHGTGQFFYKCQ